MKLVGKILRIVISITLVMFSFATFASVVSDSDGTNFITKEEIEKEKENVNKIVSDYKNSVNDSLIGKVYEFLSQYDTSVKVNSIFDSVKSSTGLKQIWWRPGNTTWDNVEPGFKFEGQATIQAGTGLPEGTPIQHTVFEQWSYSNTNGNIWKIIKDTSGNIYPVFHHKNCYNFHYSEGLRMVENGWIDNLTNMTLSIGIDGYTSTQCLQVEFIHSNPSRQNPQTKTTNSGIVSNRLVTGEKDEEGRNVFIGGTINNTTDFYCYDGDAVKTFAKGSNTVSVIGSLKFSYACNTDWDPVAVMKKGHNFNVNPVLFNSSKYRVSNFNQYAIYLNGYSGVPLNGGIPLCIAPANGKIVINLKNYSAYPALVRFQSKAFGDVVNASDLVQFEVSDNSETKDPENLPSGRMSSYTLGANDSVEISLLKLQKDNVYYVRCDPTTANKVRIEVDGDIKFYNT